MSKNDPLVVNRIFVGGIPFEADEDQLRQFFQGYGPVIECKIIRDRDTGHSKGYGFVTFADPETASALRQQETLSFLGKTVNVAEAVHRKLARPPHGPPPPRPFPHEARVRAGYGTYGLPVQRGLDRLPPGYMYYPFHPGAPYMPPYAFMPPPAQYYAPHMHPPRPNPIDMRALQDALPQVLPLPPYQPRPRAYHRHVTPDGAKL